METTMAIAAKRLPPIPPEWVVSQQQYRSWLIEREFEREQARRSVVYLWEVKKLQDQREDADRSAGVVGD